MTTEPDRPRRDVSIEEAERMPMTDEELADVAARESPRSITTGKVLDSVVMLTPDERDALVAEVRRERESLRWIEERLADEEERATQAEAEVRRLRARERKIRERLEPPLLDFGP